MVSLSILRSQEMVLLLTPQQARASVSVTGCVVPFTDTVKILEVTVDHHLTFNMHLQSICKSSYSSTKAYSIISNDQRSENCCVCATQFASRWALLITDWRRLFSSALRNPHQAGLVYNSCATTVARLNPTRHFHRDRALRWSLHRVGR